jgi:hypothetical protein
MGPRPTESNENRLMASYDESQWERKPPLCHLDRSGPGFPTSLLLITATYATLSKERRTSLTDETAHNRKSGGAEWRDLQFCPTLADDFRETEVEGDGTAGARRGIAGSAKDKRVESRKGRHSSSPARKCRVSKWKREESRRGRHKAPQDGILGGSQDDRRSAGNKPQPVFAN